MIRKRERDEKADEEKGSERRKDKKRRLVVAIRQWKGLVGKMMRRRQRRGRGRRK